VEHFGATDGLDAHVCAVPLGQRPDRLDRVLFGRVDGVRGPEGQGPFELLWIQVDGDDGAGPDESRSGDRGVADATATEDGDGVIALDVPRVHRGAEPGHHAAAEQPGGFGPGGRVHLGGLSGRDERLLGECADAECGRELGAVGERHLPGRVVGREAVPGPTPATRPTLAADGTPVEHHEVAGRDAGHVGSDRFDDPRRLVAEEVREVIADPALPVVQVGVTDAAGLDVDERLTGPGVRNDDALDAHGRSL